MRTLKTHHIVFLVCAAAAPLTVVSAGVTAAYAASGLAGVPLGYLICGGLVAMFALGFCAMAKEIPNTAAFFSYVSAGLGESHGLAASWLAIISYSMMQTALVCLLGFMAEDLLLRVTGRSVTWVLFSIVAVILVGTLGVRSADLASRIIGFLLILEFLTVLIFLHRRTDQQGPRSRRGHFFPDVSYRWRYRDAPCFHHCRIYGNRKQLHVCRGN